MSLNFNKVMMAGRLTADPELKVTPSGVNCTNFSLAVDRKQYGEKKAETDFFNVVCWRQTAEFVCKYFRKGMPIFVIGAVQNRSWVDSKGEKHYATDIVADEVNFVESKKEEQKAPDFTQAKMEEVKSDEDLPF